MMRTLNSRMTMNVSRLFLPLFALLPLTASAQATTRAAAPARATDGESAWRYWGGDAGQTRYAPLDQINAENFSKLEVAWTWRGDNYGPSADNILRATPIYAEGKLFSVAGARRTVVAIDPATGETLWTWRMKPTKRWERSMRQNYGKSV